MTVMPWWYAGADNDPNFNLHWGQPWHDFTQVNGAHENPYGLPISKFQEAYDYRITNPFILIETTFEGIQKNGYPVHDDYVVRRNFYRAMQCGGAGLTCGSHGLWYPTQDENDHTFEYTWGKSIPWWQALERPGGQQMSYLKSFYESTNWWQLWPRFNAIVTDPSLEENYRVLASASSQDKVVVVYFPRGVTSDMPVDYQLQGSMDAKYQYRVRWFNPRTGQTQRGAGPLTVSGVTVTLPNRVDNEDWILLLSKIGNSQPKGIGPYEQ
jgi:hypothetical protein